VSTAHVLLGLLARGSRHGYDLKREHDARLPRARPLAFGQVYATLGRLVRDELIAEAGQDRDGGPERTSFALTERGRAELDTWLDRVEEPAPFVQSTLFAKVVVALLVHEDASAARQYLSAQRAAHLARMRELTAAKSNRHAAVADVVAADYAIAHLDADLRWMRTTAERVESLRIEVHQ
jgi:DNA-binding PadR family transcriptional regulator